MNILGPAVSPTVANGVVTQVGVQDGLGGGLPSVGCVALIGGISRGYGGWSCIVLHKAAC